jgi:hypothetical protein
LVKEILLGSDNVVTEDIYLAALQATLFIQLAYEPTYPHFSHNFQQKRLSKIPTLTFRIKKMVALGRF